MEQKKYKYLYWGFGLRIASEIEFPELLTHNFDNHNVEYIFGKVPDSIEDITISAKSFNYVVNERELLFTVNVVAGIAQKMCVRLLFCPGNQQIN